MSNQPTVKKYKLKFFNNIASQNMSGGNGELFDKEIIENYTNIIGSGGFGLVVKHKSEPNVIKLLYDTAACDESKKEYGIHKEIYDAITLYLKEGKNKQINTSNPIDFQSFSKKMSAFGKQFSCSYRMTLIENLDKVLNNDNGLYHIILKEEEYNSRFNKKVGRVYSEPVSEENPTRGYFITESKIKEVILDNLSSSIKGDITTVNDIAHRMGLLYALLIFLAEYIPKDAEYVLSKCDEKMCVTVLDFGMFEKINFKPKISASIQGPILKIDQDIDIMKKLVRTLSESSNVDSEVIAKIIKNFQELSMETEKIKSFLKSLDNDIVEKLANDIQEIDIYFPYFDDESETNENFKNGFREGYEFSISYEKDHVKQNNKKYVYDKYMSQK